MAQGPDPSSGLDLVTLFRSSNTDAEMEAESIHTMLDANGVPSLVQGDSVIPSLEFQVLVPRASLEEAQRPVREARDAGPAAAEEAEADSEQRQ